jgi:hypothetical protein
MSVSSAVQSLGLLGPGAIVDPKQDQDPAKYPTLVPTSMLPPGPQRIVMPGTGAGTSTDMGPIPTFTAFGQTLPPSFWNLTEPVNLNDFNEEGGPIGQPDPDFDPVHGSLTVDPEPLDPVSSNVGFNVADALFTGLGLLNPAFALLSLPFTIARGYNYFFGEDEAQTQNMEPFGIDPLGQFTGIGGPTGSDDTSDDPNVSSGADEAAAVAVGFDVDEDDIAAEMTTDDTPPGGDDSPSDDGGGDPSPTDAGDDGAGGAPWHQGGLLPGSGPKDITAEGGEYIIRKSAVDKYGPDLFNLLNKGLLSAS